MLDLNDKAIDDHTRKSSTAIAKVWSYYLANLCKILRSQSPEHNHGFSLLESLIAVAVVSILIVAIAPMIALSTSARINARRIDQATQAGRSYIDAVRGGVINVTEFPTYLVKNEVNAQGQYVFENPQDVTKTVEAPTAARFNPATICDNSLANNVTGGKVPGICIDVDGNGFSINDPQDLFIQPMRSGPTGASAGLDLQRQGFWLAVRVYRADALAATTAIRTGTEASCNAGDTAFSSTASITCPLVVMRSQILPNVNNNLEDIKQGTGSSN